MEGHIVKVTTQLFTSEKTPIAFSIIWEALRTDLEGKIDDKKKNYKMHTTEFDEVTKNKVGRRLRTVLSAKRVTLRSPEGNVKAYKFDREKLLRVARKYGYKDLHTDLPLHTDLTDSQSIKEHKTTLESHEKPLEKDVEKHTLIPQPIGAIGESVCKIDIQTVLSSSALDPVTRGNCPICKKRNVSLVWQVLMLDGSRYDAVCMDCGGYLQEELRKRDQA